MPDSRRYGIANGELRDQFCHSSCAFLTQILLPAESEEPLAADCLPLAQTGAAAAPQANRLCQPH